MKPLIKWYGGKMNMVNHILPLIPAHKSYIEPFCGGAAIFFAKPLARLNVLNDKMELLVNFYRQAKKFPKEFLAEIDSMPYAKTEHERTKQIISDSPDKHEPIVRAAAFWYQCGCSFLSVPGRTWARQINCEAKALNAFLAHKSRLSECLSILDHAQIESEDAIACIGRYDTPTAFFFVDPPYVDTNCGHYLGYTQSNFDNLLQCLSKIKGKFMMSSFENDSLTAAVEQHGWYQHRIEQVARAKMGINGSGKNKVEVLTMNYKLGDADNLF